MRLRVDEGVYIDFINLHADAGTEAGDETARTANIKQVGCVHQSNHKISHKYILRLPTISMPTLQAMLLSSMATPTRAILGMRP